MPVFNFGVGGCGVGVNVKLHNYPSTFPNTAETDTIGFISSVAPNGYYIAEAKPSGSSFPNGFVFIRTATNSTTPIEIAENVYILPFAVEQWYDNAWNGCRAMCYQGGWRAFYNYLFKTSSVSVGEANILDFRSGNTNVATIQKEYIKISASGSQSPRICSHTTVNVSDYRYLKIDITRLSGTADLYFGLNATFNNTENSVPNVISKAIVSGSGVTTLDISAINTTSYVKINGTASGAREYRINNVWLEG